MVLGKHSGRHALVDKLLKLGIAADSFDMDALLAKVRDRAQRNKKPLTDLDMLALCRPEKSVA